MSITFHSTSFATISITFHSTRCATISTSIYPTFYATLHPTNLPAASARVTTSLAATTNASRSIGAPAKAAIFTGGTPYTSSPPSFPCSNYAYLPRGSQPLQTQPVLQH